MTDKSESDPGNFGHEQDQHQKNKKKKILRGEKYSKDSEENRS